LTEPERINFKEVIAEIERRGKSLYYIAKLTRRQYVQVQRWKEGASIQHYEGQMLLAILDDLKNDVPRETLHGVTIENTQTQN
jgi:hypothetical protein